MQESNVQNICQISIYPDFTGKKNIMFHSKSYIMAFSEDYLEFVLDQLSGYGPLTHKKMFGGVGIYKDGLMFAGLMGGNFHLKVDDESRQEFIDRGMNSFFHNPKSKGLPSYYEVPVEILENREELMIWAEKACQAAQRSKKK